MDKTVANWHSIDRKAEHHSLSFPIPLLEKDSLDFSFSGLKSAALREIQTRKASQNGNLSQEDIGEICSAYQSSVTQVLVTKILRATQEYKTSHVYLV